MEKQIKEYSKILTDWNKLVQKKILAAAAAGVGIGDNSLWPILCPKSFLKAERQLF